MSPSSEQNLCSPIGEEGGGYQPEVCRLVSWPTDVTQLRAEPLGPMGEGGGGYQSEVCRLVSWPTDVTQLRAEPLQSHGRGRGRLPVRGM